MTDQDFLLMFLECVLKWKLKLASMSNFLFTTTALPAERRTRMERLRFKMLLIWRRVFSSSCLIWLWKFVLQLSSQNFLSERPLKGCSQSRHTFLVGKVVLIWYQPAGVSSDGYKNITRDTYKNVCKRLLYG